jgi:hypothetical protein
MFLKMALHIHSMALKWHSALSLFSCVLASVSFLNRVKIFSGVRFCVLSFHLSFIFSILCYVSSIVYSFFLCFIVKVVIVTTFPDSRLCSIILISVHTIGWSTIIIIINGKFYTLWSNSYFNSSCFNDSFVFI